LRVCNRYLTDIVGRHSYARTASSVRVGESGAQ
jgi:hypothetical protein